MTALPADGSESALVARWLEGFRGPLRLQDGRPLQVIFPGVAGPGPGPDVRDALLDAGGDYLKGDVEVHLVASGWPAHGHGRDVAYGGVVLHVVGHDDVGAPFTLHGAGRTIPILVLPGAIAPSIAGEGFTPPCAFDAAGGRDGGPALRALSLRRLRMKAARVQPEVDGAGPAQALYGALLTTLGGPTNAVAFATMANRVPLGAIIESANARPPGASRPFAITAALKGAALDLPFRRSGIRPAASPERRLEGAGALIHTLWPGAEHGWPPALTPEAWLPRVLQARGIGRAMAIETAVNAVLPVALAGALWPESRVHDAWFSLASPGTYSHLRNLESWLGAGGTRPFRTAAAVQAGLLLHDEYCSRGRCGRCPFSDRS